MQIRKKSSIIVVDHNNGDDALNKEKKKFKVSGTLIFNLAVGVITVFLMIYFIVSDGGMIDLLKSRDGIIVGWLIVALAVFDMNIVMDAIVTFTFIRSKYPDLKFLQAIKITCVGVFFSAITPSSTGGQPMQLYLMSKMNISVGFGSACMTQKFIVYQFVTMAFSIFAIVVKFDLFSGAFTGFWSSAFIILGFAVQLGITALFIIVSFSSRLTKKLLALIGKILNKFKIKNADGKLKKLSKEFEMFHTSNKALMSDKKRMVLIYALVSVQVLLILSVPFFIYLALDMPKIAAEMNMPQGNWFNFICIQSFVLFTSNLIPLPGASGGAEAAFALYYDPLFGFRTKPAIVIWRFITYYGAMILTVPFSYYTKGHKEHSKEIEEELEESLEEIPENVSSGSE